MTLLNAAQLVLLGILTLLIGVPAILLALLLPGKALKGKLFLVVSKTYARIALWFFRIQVVGRGLANIDPGKPYVFMSNHASHADSPALALVISHPLHWVFKKELARIPVFGWALLACGQIMVDRASPEKSREALAEALSGLSGNNSVMIYPEGTRSRDGDLLPFKKGGFRMAFRWGCRSSRCGCRGAARSWPPTRSGSVPAPSRSRSSRRSRPGARPRPTSPTS